MFKAGMALTLLGGLGIVLFLSGQAVVGACSNGLGILAALAVLGLFPGIVLLAIVYNSTSH